MLYEHLAMRDPDYVHTHLGAEGLCRAGIVGLDMQEINTARICTRTPTTSLADPSVPRKASGTPTAPSGAQYHEEQCSTTSRDVPWHIDTTGYTRLGEPGWRAAHSMGGVPFYTRGSTPSYPPASSWGSLGIGSRYHVEQDGGFGDKCTHSDLPLPCVSDEDCHADYRCHQVHHASGSIWAHVAFRFTMRF